MNALLLDVSVLFALIYDRHQRHEDVQKWFGAGGSKSWATCALTELSTVRLLAAGFAPDLHVSLPFAAALVRRLCAHRGHHYWEETFSPVSGGAFHWDRMSAFHPGRNAFPDLYLLALAVHNHGALVTLDRRIATEFVAGARAENVVVL